ncbi:MAG: hemolysin family protein [Eubacteriales bacterium]
MLIFLNAIFACAEIAVISMNDNKIAKMVTQGEKRAVRLSKLTDQPARFLATIQVAITLAGFLGSAYAADHFSGNLVALFAKIGIRLPNGLAVLLITLVLSYFMLVFGELVPKRVAMKNADKLALGLSGILALLAAVFSPIVWLLTVSTNGILRLLGIDPHAEDETFSEEEIRMMVDVGSEKGVIDANEKYLIQNVFEFDDLTVADFVTHRTDISLLWMDESLEEWDKTIHESRHSLYPVCDETVDHVVGILNAKDYFRMPEKTKAEVIAQCIKPAYFVPETIRADVLFRQMQQTKNHFAVVLDEYGGVSGIVTMSDLLEQLVGDLEDDSSDEQEPPEIERIDSQTWKIRGSALLEDVKEQLQAELPTEEYDTFGGMVFGAYGSVPEEGTTFEIDIGELHVKVLEIKDHRIVKTLVCRLSPEPTEEEKNAGALESTSQ